MELARRVALNAKLAPMLHIAQAVRICYISNQMELASLVTRAIASNVPRLIAVSVKMDTIFNLVIVLFARVTVYCVIV